MKIAIIVDNFPKVSELFIATQAVGLIESGHEVHFYATGHTNERVQPIIIKHHLLDKTTFCKTSTGYGKLLLLLFRFWFHYPKSFLQSIRFIKESKKRGEYINRSLFEWGISIPKEHYDVIHAHFGYNGLPIATLRSWGILTQPRFVVTFHGCDFLPQPAYPNMYHLLFQNVDTVIQVTNYAKQEAIKQGFLIEKIKIVPCGLNEDLLVHEKTKNYNMTQPLRLVFLGRLIPFKNPQGVIEICHLLIENGIQIKCNIIGDGPLMKICVEKIKEYQLGGIVSLNGTCTSDKVKTLLSDSDIFVFPGIYDETGRAENQGCVTQEAQVMNLPVLCTSAGGTHECIRNGENGFILSNDNNYKQFVEKITWFDSHREELQRMGETAMDFVRNKYNNTLIINQLEKIYSKKINY